MAEPGCLHDAHFEHLEVSGDTTLTGNVTVGGATSLATTPQMTVGTGISAVSNAIVKHSVITTGNIIETTIILDLTDLNSGDADGDIIGKADTANCHYGQITAAVNGTILSGYCQCLETPVTGEADIDIFSAAEATGKEDTLITDLNEVKLLESTADWTNTTAPKGFTSVPRANDYIYLVASGDSTNATYSAGKFLLKFYGYAA